MEKTIIQKDGYKLIGEECAHSLEKFTIKSKGDCNDADYTYRTETLSKTEFEEILPYLKIVIDNAVGSHLVDDENYSDTMETIKDECLKLLGDDVPETILENHDSKEDYIEYVVDGIFELFVLTGHDDRASAHTLEYVKIKYTDEKGADYEVELD